MGIRIDIYFRDPNVRNYEYTKVESYSVDHGVLRIKGPDYEDFRALSPGDYVSVTFYKDEDA